MSCFLYLLTIVITCANDYLFRNYLFKTKSECVSTEGLVSLGHEHRWYSGVLKYGHSVDIIYTLNVCMVRIFKLAALLQQREEKQLETSVESLISRVAHVKAALHSFIYKLENEYERLMWWVNWIETDFTLTIRNLGVSFCGASIGKHPGTLTLTPERKAPGARLLRYTTINICILSQMFDNTSEIPSKANCLVCKSCCKPLEQFYSRLTWRTRQEHGGNNLWMRRSVTSMVVKSSLGHLNFKGS